MISETRKEAIILIRNKHLRTQFSSTVSCFRSFPNFLIVSHNWSCKTGVRRGLQCLNVSLKLFAFYLSGFFFFLFFFVFFYLFFFCFFCFFVCFFCFVFFFFFCFFVSFICCWPIKYDDSGKNSFKAGNISPRSPSRIKVTKIYMLRLCVVQITCKEKRIKYMIRNMSQLMWKGYLSHMLTTKAHQSLHCSLTQYRKLEKGFRQMTKDLAPLDNCAYEPPHDKTSKMACVPSEDSGQPRLPPSLIKVFAVRMKKALVLSYPLKAQRRFWSDWADAQVDLSLRWAHMPFRCFFFIFHEAAHMYLKNTNSTKLKSLLLWVGSYELYECITHRAIDDKHKSFYWYHVHFTNIFRSPCCWSFQLLLLLNGKKSII